MNTKKIGIIGLGMVGGALQNYFAGKHEVFVYDKYKKIGSPDSISKADFIFVCVPTPFDKESGFSLLEIKDAISIIKGRKVVIIKSTVLPGTTETFQEKYPNHYFVFNPEFLTESSADQDMKYPDRQIIGYTKKSYRLAKDILLMLPLAPFGRIVPAMMAEFIKYWSNTYFAQKVAFNNQMFDIWEKLGGTDRSYKTLIECVSADKRIEASHLQIMHQGYRGYGGKCIPKDTKAFIDFAKQLQAEPSILKKVDAYNEQLTKNHE